MKKRELFVFSGQSNMLGACVYPASEQVYFQNSYEYIHKNKRLGLSNHGSFKKEGFPCGEFVYKFPQKAYASDIVVDGKSTLASYNINTFFTSSMCNLQSEKEKSLFDFSYFSEANAPFAVSLAPYIVIGWEELGAQCAYAHIAKGGVQIRYFFNEEMITSLNKKITHYNAGHGTAIPLQMVTETTAGAGDYFLEKIVDFFADSEEKFAGENLQTRCFFWLQGETYDGCYPRILYKLYLETLWEKLKELGFTHFFCIRVGYWMNDGIVEIMKAQEEFCSEHSDAYMLTRVCSYMPMPSQDVECWYGKENIKEFLYCRDSYFGFDNHHLNEKGFKLIADAALKNVKRILIEGKPVELEEEKCLLMK